MIEMTTVDKEGRAKIEPVILVPKDYIQAVKCKDCKHRDQCRKQISIRKYDEELAVNYLEFKQITFCSEGERRDNRDV